MLDEISLENTKKSIFSDKSKTNALENFDPDKEDIEPKNPG